MQFRRHLLPRAPCHDPARREDEGAEGAACPTPFDAAFKVFLANADTVRERVFVIEGEGGGGGGRGGESGKAPV